MYLRTFCCFSGRPVAIDWSVPKSKFQTTTSQKETDMVKDKGKTHAWWLTISKEFSVIHILFCTQVNATFYVILNTVEDTMDKESDEGSFSAEGDVEQGSENDKKEISSTSGDDDEDEDGESDDDNGDDDTSDESENEKEDVSSGN